MPLNKLENFIKNTEGRILYVNPSDLDATDAIENQGNSLTKPFKTIQRALLEAARFSYLRGSDNDAIEKTTILLYPGEHVVDNRPGFGIKDVSGTARAVSPAGAETNAQTTLTLTTDSIFDLTQQDNILYKFNSIHGGVIVPRGTSIVGLDLRKTKIRPKYVPNPTDDNLSGSAIFRITGTCYFWQFSMFDGDQSGTVYTDSSDFSSANTATPTFSHHKLTCFEYADGVNIPTGFGISDLAMYYSKLSNAFNSETGRNIDQKWPADPLGFAARRPEYEIVGAFASDPVNISNVISGDGSTPNTVITVTTSTDHGLNEGTPVIIKGVGIADYNISTTVVSVLNSTTFTYNLPFVRPELPATPSAASATVTIETDTVQGASPYIFNCSLRSVFGMQGMHADGAKATGFRSMVVAQFTGISLQKDDRAYAKYNKTSRDYDVISYTKVTGAALASGSSSTNAATVYHLDSEAQYRPGWETSHIKGTNDAFIQVVSVFAIGYAFHFDAREGGDFSITNSNSNFGQYALNSSGFKKEAFNKDNKGYITSIITPKAITVAEEEIDWVTLDVGLTTAVGVSSHLYLFGYNDKNIKPPFNIQGYRVGAKLGEQISFIGAGTTFSAPVFMVDNVISQTSQGGVSTAFGITSSLKEYDVSSVSSNELNTVGGHQLLTGEKIIINSNVGDLPEGLEAHKVYFVIRVDGDTIKVASSLTNAENDEAIAITGGKQLKICSRVSEKSAGDFGSPIQFDESNSNWFVKSSTNNDIFNAFNTLGGVAALTERTTVSFITRTEDSRSLDEKLYKVRVVIPKELSNCKEPEEGFIIQESSSTSARADSDFTATSITSNDADFDRNPRFISTCSTSSNTVTLVSEIPHDIEVGEKITVKNVTSTQNTAGTLKKGYNGEFIVLTTPNDKTLTYSTTDVEGVVHTTGDFTNDTSSRTIDLPRLERTDWMGNYYIYRNDVIQPYIENVSDGIYHLYVLNASNEVEELYNSNYYSQKVDDLYPQHDRDNLNDNPESATSYAVRKPLGDVTTSDLKKSLTRETIDNILPSLGIGHSITGVSTAFTSSTEGTATLTFAQNHNFNGIVTFSSITAGSGYVNGTYQNVKLLNDGTSTWDGATAKVTVSGNAVTGVDIISGGSAYTNGETLDFDATVLGGTGGEITIATAGISSVIGNTVQITGIGTATSNHFRIVSVPATNQVAIAITNLDAKPVPGQYLINIGSEITVSTASTLPSGITTFTTEEPHGFVVGNKITVKDSSDAGLTDLIITGITTDTVTANAGIGVTLPGPKFLLKNGIASNDLTSDKDGENLGSRGLSFFGNETALLKEDITNSVSATTLKVSTTNAGLNTTGRFELGAYIQVDSEIMRITSNALSGSANDEITVLRGVMGTLKEAHSGGSLIKKIELKAVEFRRPSYLRASGHTFEYLGYGPGNYSTALPQVQIRSLNEEEETLAQAQEKSGGIVVYTGMNNDGDFYIGNKKINSATGKEKTFDIPVPTVTGEDPSLNSAVFDEVIVKERLIVEGGNSGTVLSQFDGPVTFNNDVRINGDWTQDGDLKVTGLVEFTDPTDNVLGNVDTGAFQIDGGAGIAKNLTVGAGLSVGGSVFFDGDFVVSTGATFKNIQIAVTDDNTIDTTTGNLKLGAATGFGVSIVANTTVTGILSVTDDITAFWSSDERLKNNITPITDPLQKIMSISGNTFDWNETSGKDGADTGVIAQEIEALGLPGIVTTRDNGYLAVDYHKVVPLLVEAVKQLILKVTMLEADK